MDTSGHPRIKKRAKQFLSTEKGTQKKPRESQTTLLNFNSLEPTIYLQRSKRWQQDKKQPTWICQEQATPNQPSHTKPTHVPPNVDQQWGLGWKEKLQPGFGMVSHNVLLNQAEKPTGWI